MKRIQGTQVVLRDGELLRKREDNREYLLELREDALVHAFLMEAGLYKTQVTPENMHGGWESLACELRGHFLGHWLSAAAMHYEATGDEVLRARANRIVGILARCQEENGDGWAGSIPEKYMERLERGRDVWAPQYTLHKTFMGLLDVYELTGNEQALEVADHFGEWFEKWTGKFTEEEFQKILGVETGGMLEIWAILYRITKKDRYAVLMQRYYRKALFDALLDGRDVLTNMHANTTVPEIMGAAACYEVTGEEKFLDIVKAYWEQAVDSRGTYATGGQTCGEIWTPKWKMSARLGQKNQEYCTVYNMMRLADFLFIHTGDSKYMDYWERNLYNGIMAQGHWQGSFTHGYKSLYPTQGLISYFLPLHGGAQKPWASKTNDFFCCHGSLVQANAAHNKGIYYQSEDGIYVCQYLNSDCVTGEGEDQIRVKQVIDPCNGSVMDALDGLGTQAINGFNCVQETMPEKLMVHLWVETEKEKTVRIRIPEWVENVLLSVDGKEISDISQVQGFAAVRVAGQSHIQMTFGKKIRTVLLPGTENMVAFLDGPVVLAGLCEEERTLYVKEGQEAKDILVPDNEREWGSWKFTYKSTGQERGMRFIPLYQVGYDRYSIYFPIEKK